MNPWQMAQQIKRLLETVRWSASGDVVFGDHGSVAVFAGAPTEEQIPPGFPWCLVGIADAEVDPDDPGLLTQQFRLMIAAEVAGDRMGEHAILGGGAQALGKSAGRGVGEVSERVRSAVQALTGADGAKILVSAISLGAPTAIGRGRHLAMEEVTVSALCTSAKHFAAPQHLRWVNPSWVWEGSHCAARFDFYRYRLVRKTGTAPPIDADDGTVLYTGTEPTWTGVRANGYTYGVFADYNSRGVASVEGTSGPEVGSYRIA